MRLYKAMIRLCRAIRRLHRAMIRLNKANTRVLSIMSFSDAVLQNSVQKHIWSTKNPNTWLQFSSTSYLLIWQCIMSVINPGIPRLKVTDPTVLSIKELISREGSDWEAPFATQESLIPLSDERPESHTRPSTLITLTENSMWSPVFWSFFWEFQFIDSEQN